jgi:RNA polymerase sigma-70 factor (ECF subfamily)
MAHEPACYALALRLAGQPAEAEDVCQDAFVRASRDIASAGPIRNTRSWLFKLVVHSCGHRAQSEAARRRREELAAMQQTVSQGAAADAAGRAELRQQLDASLRQLDERLRLPIVLHYEQGLSYADAADVLDLPEGTVATNIRRGLEELKGLMVKAGYACTVPAVVGVLGQGAAVAVPAGLTAFIQSLTAGGVGKAAAGVALKVSARLGAKKVMALALGWKVAAVAGAVAVTGIGASLVVDALSDRPSAVVSPAEEADLVAAAARCKTVADLRALAPRIRAASERMLSDPDFDPDRLVGLEFAEVAARTAREDWQVPAPVLAIRLALGRTGGSPTKSPERLGQLRELRPLVAEVCLARHRQRYGEALELVRKIERKHSGRTPRIVLLEAALILKENPEAYEIAWTRMASFPYLMHVPTAMHRSLRWLDRQVSADDGTQILWALWLFADVQEFGPAGSRLGRYVAADKDSYLGGRGLSATVAELLSPAPGIDTSLPLDIQPVAHALCERIQRGLKSFPPN